MSKIFIVEEYTLCKMDYVVEAKDAKEASKKFETGDYYNFGNTPEGVATSGISLRIPTENDENDRLFIDALKEVENDKLPVEEKVVVKKKRGRPRKNAS